MNEIPLNNAVAYCALVALLAFGLLALAWRCCKHVAKYGISFAIAFTGLIVVTTIAGGAQKKRMNLYVSHTDAKGFDLSWDYGDLTVDDFLDDETVKIKVEISSLDYVLQVATVPAACTNWHINAVNCGLPKDWMRYNVKVSASCNNGLLYGSIRRRGDDVVALDSIYDDKNGKRTRPRHRPCIHIDNL